MVLATRRGRRLVRAHVLPVGAPVADQHRVRSPARRSRLAALFGGSIGVTLAYITALACALAAFDGGLSYRPGRAPSTSARR